MNRIKRYLIAIGTTVCGVLITILGLQRKIIKKQKQELDDRTVQIRRQQEVVKAYEDASQGIPEVVQEALAKRQETYGRIEEARQDEAPIKQSIAVGNDIVDSFNNRL